MFFLLIHAVKSGCKHEERSLRVMPAGLAHMDASWPGSLELSGSLCYFYLWIYVVRFRAKVREVGLRRHPGSHEWMGVVSEPLTVLSLWRSSGREQSDPANSRVLFLNQLSILVTWWGCTVGSLHPFYKPLVPWHSTVFILSLIKFFFVFE